MSKKVRGATVDSVSGTTTSPPLFSILFENRTPKFMAIFVAVWLFIPVFVIFYLFKSGFSHRLGKNDTFRYSILRLISVTAQIIVVLTGLLIVGGLRFGIKFVASLIIGILLVVCISGMMVILSSAKLARRTMVTKVLFSSILLVVSLMVGYSLYALTNSVKIGVVFIALSIPVVYAVTVWTNFVYYITLFLYPNETKTFIHMQDELKQFKTDFTETFKGARYTHTGDEYVNNESLGTFNSADTSPRADVVPKTIVITYKTIDTIPKFRIEEWKKLNPEYDIELYGNDECDEYLRRNFSENHAETFRWIKDGPIKADYFRTYKMYRDGGVYADVDIVPIVSLSKVKPNESFWMPMIETNLKILTYASGSINPAIFKCPPRHLFLKCMVQIYEMLRLKKVQYSYWAWSIVLVATAIYEVLTPDQRDMINLGKHNRLVEKHVGNDDYCVDVANPDYILFKIRDEAYDMKLHKFRETA